MAETTTENEAPYKETEDGRVLVPLKLAHPLAKVYAERARAETVKDYKVGDTIWVSREYGNALIDAGMVQVDPIDKEARQAALLLNRRNQPLTAKELAEKVTAEAAVGAPVEEQQSAADAKSAEKVTADGDAGAAVGAPAEKQQSAADAKSAAKK